MRIAIQKDYNTYFILPSDVNAGLVLAAIANAVVCQQSGSGRSSRFLPVEKQPTPEFLVINDDQLLPQKETEKVMMEERALAEKRWLECYTRASAAEKALNELQEKIKAAGITLA